MKKCIFSLLIVTIVSACNEAKTPVVDLPPATQVKDSITAVDSSKTVKADSNIGKGLTQEEMVDDSVFTDGSKPTSWEIAGITDVKGFKLFLKKVQTMVLNNEKEKLAKLVKYPLGKSVKTESDFIKNYDEIFSKAARLSVASINFSQIFRNSKGAMSGDGDVWFTQEGNDFKIIAINS